jgi:hypothetical protein
VPLADSPKQHPLHSGVQGFFCVVRH